MDDIPETPFAKWEELPSPPGCQYGVPCNTPSGAEDCGAPALFRVWWQDDEKDSMFVCEEHAQAIEDSEKDNG